MSTEIVELPENDQELLDRLQRRLKGMWPKVWRVRGWVTSKYGAGPRTTTEVIDEILLSEKTALLKYESCLNTVKGHVENYANFVGKIMVFVPHVFDDGSLASWPDDSYVREWDSEKYYD